MKRFILPAFARFFFIRCLRLRIMFGNNLKYSNSDFSTNGSYTRVYNSDPTFRAARWKKFFM